MEKIILNILWDSVVYLKHNTLLALLVQSFLRKPLLEPISRFPVTSPDIKNLFFYAWIVKLRVFITKNP